MRRHIDEVTSGAGDHELLVEGQRLAGAEDAVSGAGGELQSDVVLLAMGSLAPKGEERVVPRLEGGERVGGACRAPATRSATPRAPSFD
ncbi:MAG: hypothetical protein EXR66_06220 [Dehalococcoidia bacterium]|nr:hypothetical protein [Dehalococcoidia bacterium]